MKTIFITSTSSFAGKTTVGLCLALNFEGNVGYFKPLSENKDVHLFKEVLKLTEPEEKLTLANGDLNQQYKEVSQGKDLLIIESGPDLSYGAYRKLSASEIARDLDLEPIIVTGGSSETIVISCRASGHRQVLIFYLSPLVRRVSLSIYPPPACV